MGPGVATNVKTALLAMMLALWGGASVGQSAPISWPDNTTVLIVDPERVLRGAVTGRDTTRRIEEARSELIARANAVSTALAQEERALTELRNSLTREEFTSRVSEFDRRVQAARAQQDQDAEVFAREADALQRAFFERLGVIYSALLRESGAQVMLDINTVLLGDKALDVTDLVIARLDATATTAGSLDAGQRGE